MKAVIFDCFGVLATDGWLPFKTKYFGSDPELLRKSSELNKQSDSGLISYQDFIASVAKLATLSEAETRAAINDNVPNERLFNYIEQLKSKYKIGVLSNAAANWLKSIFTDSQIALFDSVAISYETGFLKPQARAYEIMLEQLGVSANQAVFIDDQEIYIEGARQSGLAAICYRDFDQMKNDLEKLLADPKR